MYTHDLDLRLRMSRSDTLNKHNCGSPESANVQITEPSVLFGSSINSSGAIPPIKQSATRHCPHSIVPPRHLSLQSSARDWSLRVRVQWTRRHAAHKSLPQIQIPRIASDREIWKGARASGLHRIMRTFHPTLKQRSHPISHLSGYGILP